MVDPRPSLALLGLRAGVAGAPRERAVDGPDLVVAGAGAASRRPAGAQLGLDVLVRRAAGALRRRQQHRDVDRDGARGRQPWQREAGIEDCPDRFLADIRAKTGGDADEVLARALVDVSARLVEWLADDLGLAPLAGHRLQLSRALGGALPHRAGPAGRATARRPRPRACAARSGST